MIRRARYVLIAFVVAISLAALERAMMAARSHGSEAGRGAFWIWAPELLEPGEPAAFFAVRDFEIPDPLGKTAELVIAADESYIVFLNGRRIGSGAYRYGAPADLYDVTADLEAGKNRLAVELRTSRGAGGLLAGLRLEGRTVLVTDGDWQIYRRYSSALLRGLPLSGGKPALVFRRHPTGRWHLAAPASRAPAPVEILPRRPLRAEKARSFWASSVWRPVAKLRGVPNEALGPWMYFDWGREVTGFLTLDLVSEDAAPGLLFLGSEVPDRDQPADELIIPVPGSEAWVDASMRTFRYVLIVGIPLARAPAVRLVLGEYEDSGGRWPPTGAPGVLGIEPPLERSRAEDEIRARVAAAR